MIVYGIALAAYGALLGYLAVEDMRRFEIKLELLPFIGLIGMWLVLQSGTPLWGALAGALVWGISVAVIHGCRPSSVGLGDIWLFGALGLCLGIMDSLFGVIVFAAASFGTAWGYSYARGKRFCRSIYPAAVPACVVLLAVCCLRAFNTFVAQQGLSLGSVAMLGLAPVGFALGVTIHMYVTTKLEMNNV